MIFHSKYFQSNVDCKMDCDLVSSVLRGDDPISLYITPRKLLVFISSTSTDTKEERDELHNILLRISTSARENGVDINLSDMRWGIPRKASSLEHSSWLRCKKELIRCKDQSSDLFFLSLQSEKYLFGIFSYNLMVDYLL